MSYSNLVVNSERNSNNKEKPPPPPLTTTTTTNEEQYLLTGARRVKSNKKTWFNSISTDVEVQLQPYQVEDHSHSHGGGGAGEEEHHHHSHSDLSHGHSHSPSPTGLSGAHNHSHFTSPPFLKKKSSLNVASEEVKFATTASVYGNLFLFVIKCIIAYESKSLVVIASAIDSALDIVSQLIVYLVMRHSTDVDKQLYPVGKSRLEPVGVVVIAALMGNAALQVNKKKKKNIKI